MKIGFTGTRAGMSARQKRGLAVLLSATSLAFQHGDAVEFHHGDCVGADAQADIICRHLMIRRVLHPGNVEHARAHSERRADVANQPELLEVREPAPPLLRNRTIVEQGLELLIAAPRERAEQLRSGTWATVRYAREEGIPVLILDP